MAHTIKKSILHVKVKSKRTAHAMEDWIQKKCQQELGVVLEKILDELSPVGTLHRIRKLEIDLGRISLEKMQSQFSKKLEKQLRTSLTKAIKKAEARSPSQPAIPEKQKAGTDLDALKIYLRSGMLPWWVSERGRSALTEIFSNLLKYSPAKLREVVRWAFTHTWQRKRLIRSFSDTHLYAVLNTLKPGSEEYFRMKLASWSGLGDISRAYSGTGERMDLWEETFYDLTGLGVPPIRSVFPQQTPDTPANDSDNPADGLDTSSSKTNKPIEESRALSEDLSTLSEEPSDRIEESRTSANNPNSITTPKVSDSSSPLPSLLSDSQRTEGREPVTFSESSFDQSSEVYIQNAGLVIFWPLLADFFTELGLLEDNAFIDSSASNRALLLLHYLAYGEAEAPEFQLPLNKLLCGVPLPKAVELFLTLSESEINASEALIESLSQYNPSWKKISILSLRQKWIQREGVLTHQQGRLLLHVQRELMDMLLDQLPWEIDLIKLPWMEEAISVYW